MCAGWGCGGGSSSSRTTQPDRSHDDIGKRIEQAARERGLIVRGAPDMVSVAPPLTITFEQIDDLVERLTVAISDILDAS